MCLEGRFFEEEFEAPEFILDLLGVPGEMDGSLLMGTVLEARYLLEDGCSVDSYSFLLSLFLG